jgi:transcriptional regulator with XRE-family HTH domain
MNTLAERLAYILKERGKTAADLARATGKTESAVSQWLSGETKSMRSDSLMATCDLLSCNPQWLASGKGPMEIAKAVFEGSFEPLKASVHIESSPPKPTVTSSGQPTVFASNQAPALIGSAGIATNNVVTDAEIVEMISDKLGALTDDQRKDMSGKLAALALAPDSPTLKKSISESLGSAPSVAVVGNTKTPDFLKR